LKANGLFFDPVKLNKERANNKPLIWRDFIW